MVSGWQPCLSAQIIGSSVDGTAFMLESARCMCGGGRGAGVDLLLDGEAVLPEARVKLNAVGPRQRPLPVVPTLLELAHVPAAAAVAEVACGRSGVWA